MKEAKAGKILFQTTSVGKTNLMSSHGVCAHRCSKIYKEGVESHLKIKISQIQRDDRMRPDTATELSNTI
jgi:hypothetical protein